MKNYYWEKYNYYGNLIGKLIDNKPCDWKTLFKELAEIDIQLGFSCYERDKLVECISNLRASWDNKKSYFIRKEKTDISKAKDHLISMIIDMDVFINHKIDSNSISPERYDDLKGIESRIKEIARYLGIEREDYETED